MMKLSGMLCIFLSCCMMGCEMEGRFRKRWMFLREMKETLRFLEKEMTWHRTPLPEALKAAAKICRTSLGSILQSCAARAEERGGQSFGEIWRQSISEKLPSGLLEEAEYLALLDVEDALCNADTVMQKSQLQKQEQRFWALCESAQEEWKMKGTLYRRLFMAAGFALVILLL